VDRLPLEPRGRQGTGLPDESSRRRGGQADRLQVERVGPRLVARLEAAGPRGRGRGSRRPARGRGGRGEYEEEDGEADRAAPAPIQARRRGLPARDPLARPRLRRREEDVFPADLRPVRRLESRLVARRRPDRLREQPHPAGRRRIPEHRHLRGRGARGRDPARGGERAGPGHQPRVEPRRAVACVRGGRRPEAPVVRREPPGARPGGGGALAAAHGGARPQRRGSPLRARRPFGPVPARGRRKPAPSARGRRGRQRPSRGRGRAGRAGVRRRQGRDDRGARELVAAAGRDLPRRCSA